jgi:hypothetical protein
MYAELAEFRQRMNQVAHAEPDDSKQFSEFEPTSSTMAQ